ncbi:MAG TPA: 3-dehydroquinate synthase [Acidimicrobiia bacterium]|nr:3-dehydroquinate synthase [Acidimicrobiia bacterium]
MRRVTVGLPEPYDVVVGDGVLADVGDMLGGRRKVAVVSQAGVADWHAPEITAALHAAGVETDVFLIGDGEGAKTLATVDDLCSQLARWGLLRGDAVVALGGGVVGDTAGFAAAVYYRGVSVVQAPTTLLAQVDAAIGGKTAVNLPEGKNLVGAFHQPLGVLADVATLTTLPPREYRAGLGEVAKYALMPGGEGVATIVGAGAAPILERDATTLTALVAACAAMKAEVVAADPEERTGVRASLNYGHTLAHALETAGGYELLHGEAVAVGLVFAGALAGALERLDAAAVDRHRAVVESLGLPARVPGEVAATALLDVMRRDKKSAGGLTFVLPGEEGLETVHDPDPRALDVAFAAVGVAHEGSREAGRTR